jgi:hypothetical protein
MSEDENSNNGDEVAGKADEMFEQLADEMGIDRFIIAFLTMAYEERAQVKFQDEGNPSEGEFAAFRTYLINNYKKMSDVGYWILSMQSQNVFTVKLEGGGKFDNESAQELSTRIENWALANGAQKQGGCYVATAVYGSYNCPAVWTLRRYRDQTLGQSLIGRAFIKTYYAVSPVLLKWFAGSSWFNAAAKPLLNRIVEGLRERGYSDTPYYD